jgi:hypothetical protein
MLKSLDWIFFGRNNIKLFWLKTNVWKKLVLKKDSNRWRLKNKYEGNEPLLDGTQRSMARQGENSCLRMADNAYVLGLFIEFNFPWE